MYVYENFNLLLESEILICAQERPQGKRCSVKKNQVTYTAIMFSITTTANLYKLLY